jgi:hypothetical protein
LTNNGRNSAQARMAYKFWQVSSCSITDAADTFGVEPEDIMAVYRSTHPIQYWLMAAKVTLIIRAAFIVAAARHLLGYQRKED